MNLQDYQIWWTMDFWNVRQIFDSIRRFVWRLKICNLDPCNISKSTLNWYKDQGVESINIFQVWSKLWFWIKFVKCPYSQCSKNYLSINQNESMVDCSMLHYFTLLEALKLLIATQKEICHLNHYPFQQCNELLHFFLWLANNILC